MQALHRQVRVADEAWIALALLHHELPDRESFSAQEILDRVRVEHAHPQLRPGVPIHIYQHNVANSRPNPAGYRMFYKLEDDTYRLFRPSDPAHPDRRGKMLPEHDEIPEKYHYLLDWYERDYCKNQSEIDEESDPILQMRGVGKEIWADTNADDYVRSLRENWYGGNDEDK